MQGLPKLDRIDIDILSQLQKNGRLTNVALADAVGLTTSPCLQRVKRLEKAGYIDCYRAHIDLARLTDFVTVFTEVTLNDHKRDYIITFESEIRQFKTMQECHLISGGYDYLLKFVARNIAHYQEIIESVLERDIGVEKYFSYVVIKSVVTRDQVPISALLAGSAAGDRL